MNVDELYDLVEGFLDIKQRWGILIPQQKKSHVYYMIPFG